MVEQYWIKIGPQALWRYNLVITPEEYKANNLQVVVRPMPRKRDSVRYGVKWASSRPGDAVARGSKGKLGLVLQGVSLLTRIPFKVLAGVVGAALATLSWDRNR